MNFDSITDGAVIPSSQLDQLVITATASAAVTITVGGTAIVAGTFYPTGGTIVLCDLGDLFLQRLRHAFAATCVVTAATVTRSFTVIHCRADVAADYLSTQFATLLATGHILGAADRHLLASLTGGDVTIEATYYDGAAITHQTVSRSPLSAAELDAILPAGALPTEYAAVPGASAPGLPSYSFYDVSPAALTDDTHGTLAHYNVRDSARSTRIIYDPTRPTPSATIVFINAFGVPEFLHCTGTLAHEPTYERQSARIAGQLTDYDIRETDIIKLHTGPLTPAEAAWATEVLRAYSLWLIHDGKTQPVVVKEAEPKYDNQDNTIAEFVFSLQPTAAAPVVTTPAVARVFDDTFDTTFE